MTPVEAITRAITWAVETHQLTAAQVADARAWLETHQPKAEPTIRLIIPGPVPRKNARTRIRVVVSPKPPRSNKAPRCPRCKSRLSLFPQPYPTDEWKDWVQRLQLETGNLPRIAKGAWSIRVRTYVDTVRHLDDDQLHVAHGDVDSATSCVLDGLQAAGLVDDDARFVREGATKHFDAAGPRTEVEISPVESAVRKPGKTKRAASGTLPLL